MDPIQTPTSAPSAAPAAAAPVSPAAPATPAPVAAATEPKTLNDYAELAARSLNGEPPQPAAASPATEPPPAGQEPSPAAAENEPAQPTSEIDSPAATEGEEPTADEMANWTEGEKRLHGALKKERQQSKEARAKNRELEARLAQLETKLTTPPAAQAAPEQPAAQTPPVPVTAEALADCETFEAIDARVQQAATAEAQAVRLQNLLTRNGSEPVIERLKASGVENINGVPVEEASPDQIGDFLDTVYAGARQAQAQAPVRKSWLLQNREHLQTAVQAVPEFNDPQSAAYQAAQRILRENPQLRQRADWPVVLAKLYLGEQGFETKIKPAAPAAPAAAPAKAATPRPAVRPAPGAPRTATAAIPQPTASEALKAKIANGTANLAEVQQYTRGFITA